MKVSYQDLKHTTNLFRDFIYNFEKVDSFYAGDFRKLESFEKCFEALQRRHFHREEIASILEKQNSEWGASEHTMTNISYLKEASSVAVFTGQQVGILGGPLFTVYKAISVVKLAEDLSEKLKTRVIPLFWLATDDHNFLEVNHIYLLNTQSQVNKLEYHPQIEWQGKPMAKVVLDETINDFLQVLEVNLTQTKYRNEVFQKLHEFYKPEEHLAAGFARWLTTLLGKYGLVLVNPADENLKRLAVPIFEKEIEQNGTLENVFRETNLQLQQNHYHQQIKKKENYLNILVDNGQRSTIRKEKETLLVDGTGEKFNSQKLKELLKERPNLFSPNVVLRPIVQSFLFPTLAYVGGPSEVAYFAQLKKLHQVLDINMPVVYPRSALILLEKKTLEILEKYNLDIKSIFSPDIELVINQTVEKTLPSDWEANFRETQLHIKQNFEKLEQEIIQIEPTLKETFSTSKSKFDLELNKLKEKYFQAYKRKNNIIREQVYKLRNHLFPENELQERKFNIVYYLNKYGLVLIDFLYENIGADDFEPKILVLKD